MTIEIVDFPLNSMVIFQFVMWQFTRPGNIQYLWISNIDPDEVRFPDSTAMSQNPRSAVPHHLASSLHGSENKVGPWPEAPGEGRFHDGRLRI